MHSCYVFDAIERQQHRQLRHKTDLVYSRGAKTVLILTVLPAPQQHRLQPVCSKATIVDLYQVPV